MIGLMILPFSAQAGMTIDRYFKTQEKNEAENAESASAKKDDFSLSGYAESGGRSTAEDYEEEDTDDDYAYRSYHLKLRQKVSDRLSYDIGSFIYGRDYKSKDSLDNISGIFKTNWSYNIDRLKDEALELGIKVNYKEKRYENTPRNEYDEIRFAPMLTFKKKNVYSVDLILGIDNYDYLEAGEKDQLKISGRIAAVRYFRDKKLKLISSYRIEQSERETTGRERTKHEVLAGLDYVFDIPLIYKVTARAGWGKRDTKEDEERDDDLDYEYCRLYGGTEHKIGPELITNIKYQYLRKDYIHADLDSRGFYIQNSWDYEALDNTSRRIWFHLELEHKDVSYSLRSGNDYRKETAGVDVNYRRKKEWKASAGFEGNFYDFSDSAKDKKRYFARIGFERLFFAGDLALRLDLKYKYTDYKQKNDREDEAVRAGFEYKF